MITKKKEKKALSLTFDENRTFSKNNNKNRIWFKILTKIR